MLAVYSPARRPPASCRWTAVLVVHIAPLFFSNLFLFLLLDDDLKTAVVAVGRAVRVVVGEGAVRVCCR